MEWTFIHRRYLLRLCGMLLAMTTMAFSARSQTITGTVVSSADNTPLTGVSVLVKELGTGEITDFDGNFSLEVESLPVTLVFSYVGYSTQEVTVSNSQALNIALDVDDITFEEVVVVGYGEQSRATLTTAVSKLDEKVLENTVFANAATSLQGSVSGVRVQTLTGQPGAAPRVIVRGGTSINNPNGAQPLYIVSGVIRQNLDGINSSDIESIQVLKDAAATAIYGARAANGVVIVTLKKGAVGKPVISYSYNHGFSSLREKYPLLEAKDYVYFARLGAFNTGQKDPNRLSRLTGAFGEGTGNDLTKNTAFSTQVLTPENEHKLNEGWESIQDPLDPSQTLIFSNTDWQDILFQTGISRDHYLSYSGGTDDATFTAGVGFTDVDGIAIQTDYKRWSTNVQGRLKLKEGLYAFAGLNYTRESDNIVYSENQLFERSLNLPPTAKYRYEDGTLAPGFRRSIGNPEYHLGRIDNDNVDNQLTLTGGITWEIIPNLIFEPTVSLFQTSGEFNSFQKSYFDGPGAFIDSRNTTARFNKLDQQQIDATLTYDKSFDNLHNFQGKVGFSYFRRYNNSFSTTGRGAATDLISTLNAAAEPVSLTGAKSEQIILGYFGRITYDYDRKYLFAFNARLDGASNLGDENRWGFFPGISAGWNIHNEGFWSDPLTISQFKLRLSYGVNGNLGNLGDYTPQGLYSVGATYDGVAAVQYSGIANQALQWEQSNTFDIGFDMGLANNRVFVLFDYYRRVTDNLITTLALPKSTGFTSILTNLGSLQNTGVEVEVSYDVIRKNDFSWNISVNGSKNENEILELPENDNENNRIGGYQVFDPGSGQVVWRGGLQEGRTLGELYAYKQIGVYATDADAENGPIDQLVAGSDKTKRGGDVEWLDVDGNGEINTLDKVPVGNIYPDWTGGITSTLNYKNLSFYARLDYTVGHTIYNYAATQTKGQFQGNVGIHESIARSWQNQGDITDVPRYYWADQVASTNYWRGDPRNVANGNGRDLDYEKGDYLAVRELTLTYSPSLPAFEKIGLSNIRLNVTANNIKYFTKYSGLAPEDGGSDRGRYPVPQSIMFGLKASF